MELDYFYRTDFLKTCFLFLSLSSSPFRRSFIVLELSFFLIRSKLIPSTVVYNVADWKKISETILEADQQEYNNVGLIQYVL